MLQWNHSNNKSEIMPHFSRWRIGDSKGGAAIQTRNPGPSSEHFAADTGYVTNVVIVEDTRAVSSSLDRTVRLWNLASGAMLAIFTGESEIRSLAVTRGGTIVAGEQSGRVHFLRIQG
jgi:WD40 repeat protein